jgi:hypothetical protein
MNVALSTCPLQTGCSAPGQIKPPENVRFLASRPQSGPSQIYPEQLYVARLTVGLAEVDGEPDSRLIFRCPRDPMKAVGWDQHVVARTKITVTIPVNP